MSKRTRIAQEQENQKRDQFLFTHERETYSTGYKNIAGIDEAGRGPLAGPVVASAVVLHENGIIPGVFDSKKLTEQTRERLYHDILSLAKGVGVGIVEHDTIDQINILQATIMAMKIAIADLPVSYDFIFVDGMDIPEVDVPYKKIIRGDSLSQSIAAASIIAKVSRDRIMKKYHIKYPEYDFDRHKGYGTRKHLENIRTFGPSPIHRKSFKGVLF